MAAVTVHVGIAFFSQAAIEFNGKVYVGQFRIAIADKCRYHVPHAVTVTRTGLRESPVIEPGCITIAD